MTQPAYPTPAPRSELELRRTAAECRCADWLNCQWDGGEPPPVPRLFDCGALGYLLIDWPRPAYRARWFERLERLEDVA
jgi:hypothetical protein